jgi:Glycosyltransferase
VLIGYQLGLTLEDVRAIASHFGVADQIEWYEQLSQQEINVHLNRSRVNVLWSRKEGANRAIVEGMLAGVPCVMREGFNYGDHYAYMNEQTGRFSTEDNLPETLLWMVEHHDRFSPRSWVLDHMSSQIATRMIEETIRKTVGDESETALAVKVNGLSGMAYWEEQDSHRFDDDYAFLKSTITERKAAHPVRVG